ncbi:hypothetical protein Tco_0148119 [Tanacetum coccineum]
MLVQNQAPEGEGSAIPPEPQPTPFTSQPNVLALQTETPPIVSHEPQTEAHIEQVLPSPSTYQRKHRKTQKHRRAKKDSDSIFKTQSMATLNEPDPQGEGSDPPLSTVNTVRREEDSMEPDNELTDNVPPTPHDSPLSGGNTPRSDEGRMELI